MDGTAFAAWPAPVTDRQRVRARWAAAAVAVVGFVGCALSLAAPPLRGLPMHPGQQLIHVSVAASYVAAGVVATVRRPQNVIGLLMAAVGLLWLVQDLGWIPAALPFTIAITYPQLYQPVLAHLALAFPSGRLPGSRERAVVTALYVWTLVSNVGYQLFDDPRASGCTGCQRNLLLVDSSAATSGVVSTVTTAISLVVAVATILLIVRHWGRATRAAQYVMSPVLWVVVPAALYIVTEQALGLWTAPATLQRAVYNYLPIGLAVLPIGFLVGLLRTRLAYADVAASAFELAGPVAPGRVREILARTLHDPDLELVYWSPSIESYVDLDGRPQDPANIPAGRSASPISGESGPLALLVVDDAVLQEPDLVRAVVAMTRLALENERLQAEVRSQLVQLRSATNRLVDAGRQARQRIERDLHDGAQQRLLALSIDLGRAQRRLGRDGDPELREFLGQASKDLQEAITELRELARGIHPMLLTQEGLGSALHALAERAPLPVAVAAPTQRFPEAVEFATYYLVSEAVTNAARHSDARQVVVRIQAEADWLEVEVVDDGVGGAEPARGRGAGLQSMRDRVTALGGVMTLASPAGAGTRINARLPCA